jgi:hypothetical protein
MNHCQTQGCAILNTHDVSEHYCTVQFCRYANTHNVSGHQCRKCKSFGHCTQDCGQDYGEDTSISAPILIAIPLDKQCNIQGCEHKESHTADGHKCRLCNRHGHGFRACIFSSPWKILSIFPTDIDGKIYVTMRGGMGTQHFYKRDGLNNDFIEFTMCQGSWGQYGPKTSKVPDLIKFLDGYHPLRNVETHFEGAVPLFHV